MTWQHTAEWKSSCVASGAVSFSNLCCCRSQSNSSSLPCNKYSSRSNSSSNRKHSSAAVMIQKLSVAQSLEKRTLGAPLDSLVYYTYLDLRSPVVLFWHNLKSVFLSVAFTRLAEKDVLFVGKLPNLQILGPL